MKHEPSAPYGLKSYSARIRHRFAAPNAVDSPSVPARKTFAVRSSSASKAAFSHAIAWISARRRATRLAFRPCHSKPRVDENHRPLDHYACRDAANFRHYGRCKMSADVKRFLPGFLRGNECSHNVISTKIGCEIAVSRGAMRRGPSPYRSRIVHA